MKIFNSNDKENFVDDNNVFVGYDMEQSCCENASWFISESEDNNTRDDVGISEGLDSYVFDTKYFEVVKSEDVYEGGMVRFKLIAESKPERVPARRGPSIN